MKKRKEKKKQRQNFRWVNDPKASGETVLKCSVGRERERERSHSARRQTGERQRDGLRDLNLE